MNDDSKAHDTTLVRFMTPEMTRADKHFQDSIINKNEIDFGKTVSMWLPAHGDMNCQCNACTCYRLSTGEQSVIRITIPTIDLNKD